MSMQPASTRTFPAITAFIASLLFTGASFADQCVPWSLWGTGSIDERGDFGMVYDTARNVIVVHGGRPLDGDIAFTDTWEWDGEQWTQVFAGGEGGPDKNRMSFAMVYDEQREVAVLFGGREGPTGQSPSLGDTWEWDGESWTLVAETGPSPRFGHNMAYDSARGVIVLFGGNTADTWEYDGTQWSHITTGGASARTGHAMAYDPVRGVTVMHGGVTSGPFGGIVLNDTREWNGESWQLKLSGPGLEGVDGHVMVFDPTIDRIVRYGGFGGPLVDPHHTFAWDGESWSVLDTDGPPQRYLHGMVWHQQLEAVVLFGGRLPGVLHYNDLWLFEACPLPVFGDLNGDGVVDVFDLLLLLAQWGPCLEPGHCEGFCFDQAPVGCSCDDACVSMADCCPGICNNCEIAACDNCPGPGCPVDCPADLTGNGVVDVFDLLALLANWG